MTTLTPKALKEQLMAISDESYSKHQRLAELVGIGAEMKLELMKTCKNGKEVDFRYAATPEGKEESYLRIYLRGLSHKRTALLQEAKSNAGVIW